MGRILRQIACAAGVMSLVPTSRHLPQQRRAPSRSALQMASQLETLEPQLKRVVITGMGIVSCLGNSIAEVDESLASAKSGLWFNEEFAEGVRRGGYVHNMFAHHGLRCLVTQIDFPWALRVDMSKADEDGDFRLSQLEFPPGVTPMETNRGRQIGDFLLARVKRIRG